MNASELAKAVATTGYNHRLGPSAPTRPLLEGRLQFSSAMDGILLHISDMVELQNTTSIIQLPANLTVSVILQGEVNFRLGGRAFQFKAQPDGVAECFAVNLLRTCELERQLIAGNQVRKIVLSFEPGWLEQRLQGFCEQSLADFTSRHLELLSWQASPALVRRVESCLNAATMQNDLAGKLRLESEALAVAADLLNGLASRCQRPPRPANPPTLSTAVHHKAGQIKKYLENHLVVARIPASQALLSHIAADFGLSTSQLQRSFRKSFGETVVEYVRRRRLEKARDALLKGHSSIGEVAFAAGYDHASNFIIAFKKTFGVSPGELRRRMSEQ